mgnify:CR=1 FL=1
MSRYWDGITRRPAVARRARFWVGRRIAAVVTALLCFGLLSPAFSLQPAHTAAEARSEHTTLPVGSRSVSRPSGS